MNGPSLMSNCWLIILVIGSCVTFGGFPRRFSKCCFHSFILSCWFAAFNLALVVLFLLLTSFRVCLAILDCLSSTESLILPKLGKNATETYGMVQIAFGASCMNWSSVFDRHKRFKEGRESVRDNERCGRNKEVNTPELIGQRFRVLVTMLRF